MGATRNDVAVAALNAVEAYLRNPNTSVAPHEMVALISQVQDAALSLSSRKVPARLEAPAPEQLALPAPQPQADESAAYKDEQGRWDPAKVWPGVEAERSAQFERLIEEYNIGRDARGIPFTRKPRDKLISTDTMTVADPISGDYFAMLKRRLQVSYNLTHLDVLDMFDLTDAELPRTAPGFTVSKSRAAIKNGLGHHRKPKAKRAKRAA